MLIQTWQDRICSFHLHSITRITIGFRYLACWPKVRNTMVSIYVDPSHISAVCGWIFKIPNPTCHALSCWISWIRFAILEMTTWTWTKNTFFCLIGPHVPGNLQYLKPTLLYSAAQGVINSNLNFKNPSTSSWVMTGDYIYGHHCTCSTQSYLSCLWMDF